jgi:hypothetical protein
MHPDLRRALERLARTTEPVGPVIRSYRGSHLKANSIVNWFVALFHELGYAGCSSHSGRRSFITIAARNIHRSVPVCDAQIANCVLGEAIKPLPECLVVDLLPHGQQPGRRFGLVKGDGAHGRLLG